MTALQSLPNLVEALDGHASQIQFYSENATIFGQPAQNNVRLAILSMPPGSVMVVWQGTRSARHIGMTVFVHDFSLYLRAPEDPDIGYEDLYNAIVNDIPQGSPVKMLHFNVDSFCEPMDFYLPAAQRNTVVISADGATFEYFEIKASLIESMNP